MKRVFHLPPKSHGSGGITFSWQKTIGNLIATTGNCVGMDWNKDGDYLAVITDRSSIILLWDAHTLRLYEIDSGFKDALSFLSWSAVGPQLAVGSTKGNLLLYNHSTSRKVPILGKHSRKIICGCWSAENLLALGSEDKTLTVSNSDGDTLKQTSLRDLPSLTQFSEMKSDERSGMGDNTVSCVIGGKTLFLYNLQDPENPVELAFQTRYGHIVDYRWYGDGYIMIGFSQGYFVIISTHMKEIGQELFQAQDHKNNLSSVAISTSLGRCASAGDDRVRIRDLNEPSDLVSIITLEDEKSVGRVEWTEDGQLLAVATPKGSLHIFLTKLPMLGVACQTRIAYLTSLLEVTLVDPVDTSVQAKNLSVEVEPTFIGLGPEHLAVGMNNRIWFHRISESGIVPQSSEEYLGTVTSVKLNSEYAAALFEGKVMLHVHGTEVSQLSSSGRQSYRTLKARLEGESTGARDEERERRLFPDKSLGNMKITCHDLTPDFLIFGTDTGSVYFFYMEDWEFSHDIKHTCGIKKIFPNLYGTRLTDHMIPIPNFNARTMGAMWDQNFNDQEVFITFDEHSVFTHLLVADAVAAVAADSSGGKAAGQQRSAAMADGEASFIGGRQTKSADSMQGISPTCEHICTTKLPYDHSPLLLNGGQVFMHNQGGKLASMLLGSHSYLDSLDKLDELTVKEMQAMFNLAVKARRYKDAWILAEHMDSPERWSELAKATLTSLDIPLAIRLYREMGDVGMVMALQQIESHEDRNLLAGYASMFLEQFDLAQDLFLASSAPVAALDMRRDLLHWDSALQLAKALAPEEIPFISKEYAQQLEFTGDYVNALMHFEKGITRDPKHLDHDDACMAGIARVSLRLNDSKRGVAIATQSKNKFLKRDCAAILENMRQWQEAATLYEQAGFYDKAVAVYIRSKNLTKIGELLPYVSSPKLHLQYAKAREAEGRYRDAVEAYKTAKEWESVIRVCLDHLSDPEQAVKVVRESGSVEGAKLVANFFIKLSDYSSAIQFLVMSKCLIEAFQLAQKHGQMETYADIIGEDGATTDDYLSIAKHFENDRNSYLAGKFYLLAGNYERALKHFFRVPYNDS
uniref:WD_REPEATS_REGION domain-containing protein n=1 Tax=Macrostomum lignano TaxID=282301 RepID=A0A1I8I8I8_9PLAT